MPQLVTFSMMTSSNGNIFRVAGHLCEEFTGEFPTQTTVTLSYDVYFDLRPNKRLSKQSWGWWFETPSRPLWRHGNEFIEMKMFRWRNPLHLLHQKLSFWQLTMQPMSTISSKNDIFHSMFIRVTKARFRSLVKHDLSHWEKTLHVCNYFSDWLRPCLVIERKGVKVTETTRAMIQYKDVVLPV